MTTTILVVFIATKTIFLLALIVTRQKLYILRTNKRDKYEVMNVLHMLAEITLRRHVTNINATFCLSQKFAILPPSTSQQIIS